MKKLLLFVSLFVVVAFNQVLACSSDWTEGETISVIITKIKFSCQDVEQGNLSKDSSSELEITIIRYDSEGNVMSAHSIYAYVEDKVKYWEGWDWSKCGFKVANPDAKTTIALVNYFPMIVKMKDGKIASGKGTDSDYDIGNDSDSWIENAKYSARANKKLEEAIIEALREDPSYPETAKLVIEEYLEGKGYTEYDLP